MEKEKVSDKALWWLLCMALVLLYVGGNFVPNFSADTHLTYADVGGSANDMLVRNGRPVIALVYWLWAKLSINRVVMFEILYMTGVMLFGMAIYCLQSFLYRYLYGIEREIRRRLLAIFVSFILVMNPFSYQFFSFIESGCMALAVFLAVMAFLAIQKYFSTGNRSHLLLSAGLLTISVLSYQSPVGLFVILNLPFILKYTRDAKSFFLNNGIVAGVYGFASGIGLVLVKLVVRSSRASTATGNLFMRIAKAFLNTVPLLHEVLPFLFPTIVAFMTLILVLTARLKKEHWLLRLLSVLYLCMGTLIVAMMPNMFYDTPGSRVAYPIASIVGIELLYFYMQELPATHMRERLRVLAMGGALVLSLATWARFELHWVRRYWQNSQEWFIATAIGDRVEAYEDETGTEITKISVYYDGDPVDSKEVAAYQYAWSQATFFETYIHRLWEQVDNNPKYAEYFRTRDWKAYCEEQLIFDGDTLHLCIY